MPAATVTSKGRITIPAEVRRSLGLKPGSRVNFVRMDNGAYELAPTIGTITSLKGFVPAPAVPLTLGQMDAAVAEAAIDRPFR